MIIEELSDFWEFTPPLSIDSEIRCSECNVFSHYSQWGKTEVYCEDCGSHSAIRCPNCLEDFDHVYCNSFETNAKIEIEK